jgi:hypothetical protein
MIAFRRRKLAGLWPQPFNSRRLEEERVLSEKQHFWAAAHSEKRER